MTMQRPNLLVVMLDQLTPGMRGCYGNAAARRATLRA
jgi:arylsulfatase A-like enzyme